MKMTYDDKWIYYMGTYSDKMTSEEKKEYFRKMTKTEWVYKAGLIWENINDVDRYSKLIDMIIKQQITKEFINMICCGILSWYKIYTNSELKLLLDALKDGIFDLEKTYKMEEIEILLTTYQMLTNKQQIKNNELSAMENAEMEKINNLDENNNKHVKWALGRE